MLHAALRFVMTLETEREIEGGREGEREREGDCFHY